MIIYFSGTGNSYAVAKKLGEKTNDKIVALKNAINDNSENITFVFPTYCYEIPVVVRDFIKNFDINSNQKISGISTAGDNNGRSEYSFHKLIEDKGLKVSNFINLVMTDNSVPAMMKTKVEIKEIDLDKKLDEFLSQNYSGKPKNNKSNNIIAKVSEKAFYSSIGKRLLKKKVDKDKCIGCGICANICPNNNIEIINNKASVKENCTECFGCVHWCPKQAIYIRKGFKPVSQYTNKEAKINIFNK